MLKKTTLLIAFISLFAAFYSCSDDNGTDPDNTYEIRSVDGSWYGKTYSEWSIAWWQWVFEMPVGEHPLFDTAPASKGQPEDLWFLGGKITLIGESSAENVERDITVPYGKAVFFPVTSVVMMAADGDPEDSLDIYCENSLQGIDEMFCEINGERVEDIFSFKAESERKFSYTLSDNNFLDIEGGTYEDDAYASGYYLLIDNLSKGKHTLRFFIRQDWKDYKQDVIYNITVE